MNLSIREALSSDQVKRPTTAHPLITFKHEGGVPQKSIKVRKFQNVPPYLSVKKISGGQQEEGQGVVHHLQREHHQAYLMHYFQNARG